MTRLLLSRVCLGAALLAGTLASCSTENKSTSEEGASPSTAVAADTAATTPTGAYVCPMHPDVTSDKPGACPQCGMELEKQG